MSENICPICGQKVTLQQSHQMVITFEDQPDGARVAKHTAIHHECIMAAMDAEKDKQEVSK